MKYQCSKCKLAVIVIPDKEPIKACKCEAPITADLSVDLIFKGGLTIDNKHE